MSENSPVSKTVITDDEEERETLLGQSSEQVESPTTKRTNKSSDPIISPIMQVTIDFCMCFFGLQISYLIWGMMQEAIMNTQFHPTPLVPSGKFPSATFCVFSNRFLAIIISGIASYYYHGTLQSAVPLLSFTPCALSNTVSSWSQYQALSYVSFSLQTIFKSTKILPVMGMGIILKGTRYSGIEYLEAVLITIGVTLFSLSKGNWMSANPKYELLGIVLLSSYVLSDSFTSQWQSRLYRDYGKISHYQMMFGVNVSAIIITSLALLVSGEIPSVIEFLQHNPKALYYNIITAITSATGQFAVYFTIKKFGPVVFTIIMTTRQMCSILISNYLFHHKMTLQMYLGSFIVFSVLLYSAYRQTGEKKREIERKEAETKTEIQEVDLEMTSLANK